MVHDEVSGRQAGSTPTAGGELLDDDVVQVNPSHSEVWGHKPVSKGWAQTVASPYRSGAITAGFVTAI
jgi:hypothetical protein